LIKKLNLRVSRIERLN